MAPYTSRLDIKPVLDLSHVEWNVQCSHEETHPYICWIECLQEKPTQRHKCISFSVHNLFSSAITCRTGLESMNSILVDVGEIPIKAKEHKKKYPTNIALVTQGTTRSTASTTPQGCNVLKRTGLGATNGPLLLWGASGWGEACGKKGNGEPRKGTNPFFCFLFSR